MNGSGSGWLAACLVLAPGCARDPARNAGPAAGQDEDALEALRASGYAGWDDEAEPALGGVTHHQPELCAPGLNLFTNDRDEAYVMDMQGRVVHTWHVPARTACEVFELLDDGAIAAVSVGEGVTVVDRDSTLVWQVDVASHHDVALDADDHLWVPIWSERAYRGRTVRFDELLRLDPQGAHAQRWSTFEHRALLAPLHAPHPLDRDAPPGADPAVAYDYYHLNAVQPLPASELGSDPRFRQGNLLLCLRNVHLILILDRATLRPVWHWGPGELDFPHTPTWTPEGTILLFDNGRKRGWSRVLELDPRSGEVVWSYEGSPRESFFSDVRGSCQRLWNGNTLICESQRGRVFEVDAQGRIVWEFWNPDVRGEKRRRIYRFNRVPADRLASLLQAVESR